MDPVVGIWIILLTTHVCVVVTVCCLVWLLTMMRWTREDCQAMAWSMDATDENIRFIASVLITARELSAATPQEHAEFERDRVQIQDRLDNWIGPRAIRERYTNRLSGGHG